METPISIILGALVIAGVIYVQLPKVKVDNHYDQRKYEIEKAETVEVFGAGMGENSSYNTLQDVRVDMSSAVTIKEATTVNTPTAIGVKE